MGDSNGYPDAVVRKPGSPNPRGTCKGSTSCPVSEVQHAKWLCKLLVLNLSKINFIFGYARPNVF